MAGSQKKNKPQQGQKGWDIGGEMEGRGVGERLKAAGTEKKNMFA
jgi:hypothetical protein